MGAVRGLQLARARHKCRHDAGPMRWRDFSADVTRAGKKRLCCITFDRPRSRKPIQVTLWMGNRGALRRQKRPSIRVLDTDTVGFGWGLVWILPAVTMGMVGHQSPSKGVADGTDRLFFFSDGRFQETAWSQFRL